MEFTQLGRTGLKVSRLCLGTMNFGLQTMNQLTGALCALKVKLNKDAMARLDEIWPGPGGEAPEADTW